MGLRDELVLGLLVRLVDTVSDLLHLRILLVNIVDGLLLVGELVASLLANRSWSLRLALLLILGPLIHPIGTLAVVVTSITVSLAKDDLGLLAFDSFLGRSYRLDEAFGIDLLNSGDLLFG